MKILYHHRTSAQDGSAVHIDGLIHALRGHGAEVVVVAPPLSSNETRSRPRVGIVSALRSRLPRMLHELLELAYNIPEMLRLARAVRRHRPDVIYQRSNLYLLSAAWLASRVGLPLISEVNAPYFIERSRHGGLALPALARWSEDAAWRASDAVITVTGELGRIVHASGVDASRIHVMGNGIDTTMFNQAAVDPEAKARLGWGDCIVLGFTGFVREWNGLETVIELLAKPGHENLALLIVGDGPARVALEAQAVARGVQGRVRFTGRLARADVARWISAFDVAVLPAANPYASPLKLFEYMALARAIVAPDQPNIREVLQHERDAVLFRPGDQQALGDAIGQLADDAGLRQRLGTAAAQTVRTGDLTWSNNARHVLEVARRLGARQVPAAVDVVQRS